MLKICYKSAKNGIYFGAKMKRWRSISEHKGKYALEMGLCDYKINKLSPCLLSAHELWNHF